MDADKHRWDASRWWHGIPALLCGLNRRHLTWPASHSTCVLLHRGMGGVARATQILFLSPTLPSNQWFKGAFSLSPREARAGRELERGASQKGVPPLPNPLLPPASGSEGEAAEGFPGYGAPGTHHARGILSSNRWRRGGQFCCDAAALHPSVVTFSSPA